MLLYKYPTAIPSVAQAAAAEAEKRQRAEQRSRERDAAALARHKAAAVAQQESVMRSRAEAAAAAAWQVGHPFATHRITWHMGIFIHRDLCQALSRPATRFSVASAL